MMKKLFSVVSIVFLPIFLPAPLMFLKKMSYEYDLFGLQLAYRLRLFGYSGIFIFGFVIIVNNCFIFQHVTFV